MTKSDDFEFETPEQDDGEAPLEVMVHTVVGSYAVTGSDPAEVRLASTAIVDEIHRDHPEVEERAYQIECLDVLAKTREAGRKAALIIMATGLGKTTIAATDAKRFLIENPEARVLFLCHRNDISDQARERFELIIGHDGNTYGTFNGEIKDTHRVTCLFASFQTMQDWREAFGEDEFDYVIDDESHHGAAETYEPTLRYFKPRFLLGMTATPNRKDLRDIRGIFGHEVYSKPLAQALAEGLLARPDYRVIVDEIQEGTIDLDDPDISLAELNHTFFIPKRDEEMARIVQARIAEKGIQVPRIIGFCPSIEHAQRMAELIPGVLPYHSLLKKQERRDRLNAFRAGKLSGLITVDMFNEGIDIADANVIAFWRSTESETIFLQQLGRGLRKLPEKDEVLVLDFVANCDRLLMIERLLHDTLASYRRKKTSIVETDPDIEFEKVDEDDEVDLYDLEFDLVEEIETVRELQLGSFEFTETTRRIIEIVRNLTVAHERANEASVSITDLATSLGCSTGTIVNMAEKLGLSGKKMRAPKSNYIYTYLDIDAASKVSALYNERGPALPNWKPESDICAELGVTGRRFRTIKRRLGISGTPMRSIDNPTAIFFYSPAEIVRITAEHQGIVPPENVKSIPAFAEELGVAPATVRKALREEDVNPPRYQFYSQITEGLDEKTQAKVTELLSPLLEAPTAGDDVRSIYSFAIQIGTSRDILLRTLSENGIKPNSYKFGSTLAPGVTLEQQKQILSLPEIVPLPPEGTISVNAFSKVLGISFQTLKDTLERNGIVLPLFKFGPKAAGGLDLSLQAVVSALPEIIARTQAQDAPPKVKSIKVFAQQIGKSRKWVQSIIKREHIPTASYRFGSQVTQGLTPEAQEQIKTMM